MTSSIDLESMMREQRAYDWHPAVLPEQLTGTAGGN